MRQSPLPILLLITAAALIGCSAGAPVRVLEKGQTTITASLGGPIVPQSSPVGFIPYATAGAAHGLDSALTFHGNVHLLMAAFTVVGLDAGASYRVMEGQGAVPEITAAGRLLFFTDFYAWSSTRLYPDVAVNASWEVAPRTLVYAGTHATFQPSPFEWFLSPMAGVQFLISDQVSLHGELIWQAANVDTRYGVFEGQSSIGGQGSFGGFIGMEISL
jgi:hypothetical protein